MTYFQCMTCGRELAMDDNSTFCTCEYCGTKQPVPQVRSENLQTGSNVQALLDRGFMALEDGEWERADGFFEQALNSDARLGRAYLGKLMAELKVRRQDDLKDCSQPFDNRNNYQKVLRFADPALADTLKGYNSQIHVRNENERQTRIYTNAVRMMENAKTEREYKDAAGAFSLIPNYKSSGNMAKACLEQAESSRKDAAYASAEAMMTGDKIAAYETAIQIFRTIPGWRDADAKIAACRQVIDGIKTKEEADRIKAEKNKKKFVTSAIIFLTAAAVCVAVGFLLIEFIIPNSRYNAAVKLKNEGKYEDAIEAFKAMDGYRGSDEQIFACRYSQAAALMNEGKYEDAIAAFEALGNYEDSAEQILACRYSQAVALRDKGDCKAAIDAFDALDGYKDAKEQSFAVWGKIARRDTVSAGYNHTVGLKADGTVAATGANECGQCNVSDWTDIVAVSAGCYFTVGLRSDGTVVATGDNEYGQCDVSGWTDIVDISAGDNHTVGLKADGTTVAVGNNRDGQCNVSDWTDIIAVSAGRYYTVGLRSNGTVLAVGTNHYAQRDVSGWTNIVAVSAGAYHTVGLRSDGKVVVAGYNKYGQCAVSNWTDITDVSAGFYHTVGLKSDGTVVAIGESKYNKCKVSDWTNIVAVSTEAYHTVGLKSDGTVIAIGENHDSQCAVSDWKNIKLPD